MTRPGTKPRIREELYRPTTTEEAGDLARALIAAGVGRSQAWSIIGWLIDPEGVAWSPDSATVRRSEFRSALLKLPEPPWGWAEATLRASRLSGG